MRRAMRSDGRYVYSVTLDGRTVRVFPGVEAAGTDPARWYVSVNGERLSLSWPTLRQARADVTAPGFLVHSAGILDDRGEA